MSALWLPALLLGAAQPATCPAPVVLGVGTLVPLETVDPLSSKTQVKGDMVALRTSEDVRIGDALVIPKGTLATGQIADAQAKGGLGVSGRLTIRPLYLRVGGAIVRLSGATRKERGPPAGTVIGLALVSGAISGTSAKIPAGSPVPAEVEREARLCV